jgi:predicted ATPase
VRVARTGCSGLDRDFPCLAVVAALQKLYEDEDGGHRPTPLDDILLAASVSSAGGNELPPPWALDSLAAIVREHAPFVLVLDGMEAADQMSLAVLAHLRTACADSPVAVVAVTRDHAEPARAAGLLEGAARLELGPLSAADLEPSNIVELHERTGGHPLFVSAMLRAAVPNGGVAAVPHPVGEIVAARSRAFGPREHRVLRAAAILTEPFSVEGVAHLLDEGTGEVAAVLETLCSHRVLWKADDRFGFRHRLVRESLYQMLSPARRRLLASRLHAVEATEDTEPLRAA